MLSQLAIIASTVTFGGDNIGIATASMVELALVVSNIWMLVKKWKRHKYICGQYGNRTLSFIYDNVYINIEK